MFVSLNNGIKLPTIGLGTFLMSSPIVENMVQSAISTGYRLIDTAAVYRNEEHIGETLKKIISAPIKRSDIFVTSKMGPESHGSEKSSSAAISSIRCLQLEYLDLYLIHWPGVSGVKSDDARNKQLRKESYLQLEKLYQDGLFRSIGVSNYTVAHMEELLEFCSVPPAVLQIEVHPYLNQTEIRQFCKDHGIHVQAYSSLGSRDGCRELMSDPTVVQIAEETGKTCAQVLLRWAIQHGMSVIPKTSSVSRLKENFDIFDFQLSFDQMSSLDKLEKNKHYCWNPDHVV